MKQPLLLMQVSYSYTQVFFVYPVSSLFQQKVVLKSVGFKQNHKGNTHVVLSHLYFFMARK